MRDAMTHRGQDDAGLFVSGDGCVGLANRRLAIRDLSPAGHMPMGNEACAEQGRSACTEQGRSDGTVWITYNGEIYNTDELRPELERLGYTFRSSSDTEVILHGYEAWGAEVVTRLRGMFAFAIYDARPSLARPRLFIARDRLGIKPLYYARSGSGLLFASELKGMLASGLLSREISPTAVVAYLMTGSVPAPLTIYEGIEALEPGCALTWDDGRVEVHRYWDFPYETVEPESYSKAVEQIRALLEESVRIRLVSDVPLGAFLSGGLDSSAVVALMRRGTRGPIRTCSMTFEESEFSEAPYARAAAEAVGAEHYERVITAQNMADELERIFWAMDQPTIDGVNTYFVSQTAREAGLTVALSGLGGDELFGGYANTFQGVPQMLKVLSAVRAVPGAAALAEAAIGLLPDRQRWAKVKDALSRPAYPASAYLARRGLFSPAEVESIVTSEVWHAAKSAFDPIRHIAERAETRSANGSGNQLFSWVSRAELRTYTHHQLLRDTDAMSMAHSLEVRVPLLDQRL
ncbi:MAG: asparagine synthase (glutamine-hydrolyzing), partial [Chloroflexota bacterium]